MKRKVSVILLATFVIFITLSCQVICAQAEKKGQPVKLSAPVATVKSKAATKSLPVMQTSSTDTKKPIVPTTPVVVEGSEKKKPVLVKKEKKTVPVKKEEKKVKKPTPIRDKPKEEKKSTKPTEMLDTLDIEEGGNWFIKRRILEEMFKLIDEMDQVNTKIRDMRMTFFKARNDIDKEVALFVKDIGYNLGKLDQIATTILNVMERERKQEGDLSDEERSVVLAVEKVEKKVKQIQDAVQEIMSLDNKIDAEILKSLEDRINESASYRQQGWKNLQSTKKMLSDEKAQNLYNKTEALYDTMQNVLRWLQTKLLLYFNQTIKTMRNDMNTIKSDLKELQSKGINLQKEVEKIEEQEETVEKQRTKNEMEDAVEQAIERTKDKMKQEKGFFAQIKSILWYPIQLFQDAFTWIKSLFGGT